MWSRTLECSLVIRENIGVAFLLSVSHFSLYYSIFIERLNGFTIGATQVSRYRWSMVSSGYTGNNDGGRRYNSVFLCFRFEALQLSYGCTLKLLFSRSTVIVNEPLTLQLNFLTIPLSVLELACTYALITSPTYDAQLFLSSLCRSL